jgi:uncharacterized membrane protein YfhO
MFYSTEVIADETEIIDTLLEKDFLSSEKVILEEEVPLSKEGRTSPKESVLYELYKETESVLEVSAPREGILVVSDSYYPGWKVFVDGKEARILKANYAFRAVKVPAGRHKVRFVYLPESFFKGLKISGFSLGLVALIVVWDFLARRKLRSIL